MELKKKTPFHGDKKLVCFGTGLIGEEFILLAQKKEITISLFCDNDVNKWGKDFFGIPIVSLEELCQNKEDYVFFITNVRYAEEITAQLKEKGIKEIYSYQQEKMMLLADHENPIEQITYYQQKEYEAEKVQNPSGAFVSNMLMDITSYCNLKCKHCAAKIPYFESHSHKTFGEFKERIDLCGTFFDAINTFTLSGGEPLLNPDLYEMLRYAGSKEFIKQVTVVSNGTLLPKEEELDTLNKEKVKFVFSNYGPISNKISENFALLRKHRIAHQSIDNEHWFEVSHEIYDRKESKAESKEKLKNCTMNVCASISASGHFYRCSVTDNAYQKKAIPPEQLDWVDLNTETRTIPEIKKELHDYLAQDYLSICGYCAGRGADSVKIIPVAEQL